MSSSAPKLPDPGASAPDAAGGASAELGADTIEQRAAWLRRVRLFADLQREPAAIALLAGAMELRRYPAGTAILREGEVGTEAFFLVAGRVRVDKRTALGEAFPVATLEAVDHPFFGETALLESETRTATILTERESTCLVLPRREFEVFCAGHPQWALPLALRLARVLLARLHRTNGDMILLYNALVNEVRG
jgi:CRP-like cAMP-binding protein